MNRTQLFRKIRGLSRSKLRELSEEQSCLAYFGGKPESHAHERLMFSSGFRKGVKAGLRGARGADCGERRKARGRNGDASWARGYARGLKYTPDVEGVDLNIPFYTAGPAPGPKAKIKPVGNEFVHFDASQLSKADLRKLKKKGRA